MSKFIKCFTILPKELFRLNNGPLVTLRHRFVRTEGSYDVLLEGGKVIPKALNPLTYEGKYLKQTVTLVYTNYAKHSTGLQCVQIRRFSNGLLRGSKGA